MGVLSRLFHLKSVYPLISLSYSLLSMMVPPFFLGVYVFQMVYSTLWVSGQRSPVFQLSCYLTTDSENHARVIFEIECYLLYPKSMPVFYWTSKYTNQNRVCTVFCFGVCLMLVCFLNYKSVYVGERVSIHGYGRCGCGGDC